MKRLNITLPDELYREIESVHNKSRLIVEALKEKLEREKKKKLVELLIEGYQATKEEDGKLNKCGLLDYIFMSSVGLIASKSLLFKINGEWVVIIT